MLHQIKLDKVRNFKYGSRALCAIEKELGKSIYALRDKSSEDVSIVELMTIVWAGLIHEDRELTIESVMDLIDDYSDLETVGEIMGKALDQAFGGNNKGTPAPTPKGNHKKN